MEKPILIAVGTYTDKVDHAPNACGKGILLLSLNEKTGELKYVSSAEGMKNPSYIHYNPVFKRIYAVTENVAERGEILSYRVNDNNTLSLTGKQEGSGRAGCRRRGFRGRGCLCGTGGSSGSNRRHFKS